MSLIPFYFDEATVLGKLSKLFSSNKEQLSEVYQISFRKLLDLSKHPVNRVLQGHYDSLSDHQLVRLAQWLERSEGELVSSDFAWPLAGTLMHGLSDNINEQFLAIEASLQRGYNQYNTDFISYRYRYSAYGYLRRLPNNTYSFCLREFDAITEKMRGYYANEGLEPNAPAVTRKLEKFIEVLKKSRVYKLDMTDWVGADRSDTRYVLNTKNGLPLDLPVGRRLLEKPDEIFWARLKLRG